MKRRNTFIAILVVLALPLLGYISISYLAKPVNIMPRRFFADSVVSTDGEQDTIWHQIKPTKFVNQFKDSVDLTQLKGKVLIVNTFFTHCPSICATLSRSMYRLQQSIVWNDKRSHKKRESAPIHLISLSVDPERDSPEVLRKYAEKYQANHDVWWLLTGIKRTIYDYIMDELKLAVVDGENVDSNFIHSDKIILIDRNLVIRGYYSGLDSNQMNQLAKDAGLLILEKNKK